MATNGRRQTTDSLKTLQKRDLVLRGEQILRSSDFNMTRCLSLGLSILFPGVTSGGHNSLGCRDPRRPTRPTGPMIRIAGPLLPVGCRDPDCTLYALASLGALAAEAKRVLLRLRDGREVDHELPSVIQPSLQAWRHSSWRSWSTRWGCCILVVSTVFPPFLWAGSRGVLPPAGPFLYQTPVFYHKSIATANNMINHQ